MSQRLAAILAADVVGYSRMMGGDASGTLAALRELRQELFEPVVVKHGGEVIKRMGDGWLVEFGAIAGAVDCAVEVQGKLQDHERIKLRMGIHFGDIVHEDEDIYGDGVNIAARLQEHGLPGGVLISDDVRRQLDGTRKGNFAVIGELALKNIVEPVSAAIWPPSAAGEHAAAGNAGAASGRKPTITVGEFAGRGEDEMLAQGIKDDLTAALSRQTGQDYVLDEAAADYLVQGNVRSAGERCRVSAKLIDQSGGRQIWADQYDFATADPFEIQDACTYQISAAIRLHIWAREGQKAAARDVEDMTIEEILSYGTHVFSQQTCEAWAGAGPLMERVLEQEPDNFMALSMSAFSVLAEYMYGYRAAAPEKVKRAKEYADRAQRSNANSDFVYQVQSLIDATCRQSFGEAVLAARRALEINPNYAYGYGALANAQALMGAYAESIEAADRSSNFDPHNPYRHVTERSKAQAYFGLGDYDAAAAQFVLADSLMPGLPQNLMGMMASYWQAGDADYARRACARLLEMAPEIHAGEVYFPPYRDRKVYDRFRESVIADGLPA